MVARQFATDDFQILLHRDLPYQAAHMKSYLSRQKPVFGIWGSISCEPLDQFSCARHGDISARKQYTRFFPSPEGEGFVGSPRRHKKPLQQSD